MLDTCESKKADSPILRSINVNEGLRKKNSIPPFFWNYRVKVRRESTILIIWKSLPNPIFIYVKYSTEKK